MNLDKVQFYNLGALEDIPGYGQNGLVRIPIDVRYKLNDWAKLVGVESVGIEVRFVTDAPGIEFNVSMQEPLQGGTGQIRIYRGNFMCQNINVHPGKTKLCRIMLPESFEATDGRMLQQGGYAPNVWRIIFGNATFVIHDINAYGGEIRPPKKNELPKYNWLAYGSSITHSFLDGYPFLAASRLKVQVQDKGLGGGCHIEKEIVDYLVDDCEFDFITCELGINMREKYSPEEFEERAWYLIERLKSLGKPTLIITTFPNSHSEEYIVTANSSTKNETAYNDILVKLVEKANSPMIRLAHGYEILDDVNGLSADLIHPTAYGHAFMGINLVNILKPFLLDCGLEIL